MTSLMLTWLHALAHFFDSTALILVGLILVAEVISGATREVYTGGFDLKVLLGGLVWKIPMYLTVYMPLKLLQESSGLPADWAMMAFFIKEFVSVLGNWKALSDARQDPDSAVIDSLIKFFSLDKFTQLPGK